MIDSFPLLFAILIFAGFFIYAMKLGVVSLLSSGIAVGITIVVFFLGMQWVPDLASQFLDIDLLWKKTAAVVGGGALVILIIIRLVVGFICKRLFGPEGLLHSFADGFSGGVISLFPSLVIVIFLFTCIRISGTLHELNYAASLSRDGITQSADQIPAYPWTGNWRDGVENIPGMAMLLDFLDPFSNRANSNAAAYAIMGQSSLIRSYLLSQPDTSELAAREEIIRIVRDPNVFRYLESHDRVALVLNPEVRKIADHPETRPLLKSLRLQPILKGYVKALQPTDEAPPRVN